MSAVAASSATLQCQTARAYLLLREADVDPMMTMWERRNTHFGKRRQAKVEWGLCEQGDRLMWCACPSCMHVMRSKNDWGLAKLKPSIFRSRLVDGLFELKPIEWILLADCFGDGRTLYQLLDVAETARQVLDAIDALERMGLLEIIPAQITARRAS